jgi:hypothetical protein
VRGGGGPWAPWAMIGVAAVTFLFCVTAAVPAHDSYVLPSNTRAQSAHVHAAAGGPLRAPQTYQPTHCKRGLRGPRSAGNLNMNNLSFPCPSATPSGPPTGPSAGKAPRSIRPS